MGCIVYRPLCLRMYFTFVGIEGEIIYLHWRGAFGVARFDKLGDARASTRGTSDRIGSTFFAYVLTSKKVLAILEPMGINQF